MSLLIRVPPLSITDRSYTTIHCSYAILHPSYDTIHRSYAPFHRTKATELFIVTAVSRASIFIYSSAKNYLLIYANYAAGID